MHSIDGLNNIRNKPNFAFLMSNVDWPRRTCSEHNSRILMDDAAGVIGSNKAEDKRSGGVAGNVRIQLELPSRRLKMPMKSFLLMHFRSRMNMTFHENNDARITISLSLTPISQIWKDFKSVLSITISLQI